MKKQIFLPFSLFIFLCTPGIFHYSLWDDEANTGLMGKAVLRSGTVSAQVDERNLLMYRHGAELQNLHNTYLPPIPAWVVAASFKIFGVCNWSARMPFFLIGWIGVLLMLYFVWRKKIASNVSLIFAIFLISNVSLAIFLSNCRYYALAFTASIIVVLGYLLPISAWFKVGWISVGGLILAGSNYLNYAALFGVLFFDQAIKLGPRLVLNRKQWISLLANQVVVLMFLGIFYNPLGRQVVLEGERNWFVEKLTLLWWNLRDFDVAQFGSLPMLISAGAWSFLQPKSQVRNVLLRGLLALVIYTFVITLFSPQPVNQTSFADIRYLVPMIPLTLFIEAFFLCSMFDGKIRLCLAIALLTAYTNIFQLQFFRVMEFRSYFLDRVGEILRPPPEPYLPVSAWISSQVSPGQSVWVVPDYMTYPLMFHAPQAVYAWQLRPEQKKEEQFKNLPDIHFQGLVPPDYIVAFGPSVLQIRELIGQWSLQGIRYQEVTRLMTFWKDLYRPELFWRTFRPIENFDPNTEAIYIFQRQP